MDPNQLQEMVQNVVQQQLEAVREDIRRQQVTVDRIDEALRRLASDMRDIPREVERIEGEVDDISRR